MDALQNLPPIVMLVLGFIGLVWLVLVFLVPFMVEGIRQSAKKTHEELVEMNAKLDRLNALLAQGRAVQAGGEPGGAASAEPRGRREPTISETPVPPIARRERREPIVR